MKWNSLLTTWLGALLFLMGVILALALSGAVAWAASEALVYSSFNAESKLEIRCPLVLSAAESGTAHAEIANETEEEIKPVVRAEISHGKLPREVRQTMVLAPNETKRVEWTVDSGDVIFDRLILINILQSRYSDNPSFSGSCGIVVFSLLGLSGMQTFALVLVLSILLMLTGGGLWIRAHWPLDSFGESIVRVHSILFGAALLSLLSTAVRWWGLAIFLDAVIFLIAGVVLTEFAFQRGKHRN